MHIIVFMFNSNVLIKYCIRYIMLYLATYCNFNFVNEYYVHEKWNIGVFCCINQRPLDTVKGGANIVPLNVWILCIVRVYFNFIIFLLDTRTSYDDPWCNDVFWFICLNQFKSDMMKRYHQYYFPIYNTNVSFGRQKYTISPFIHMSF